jgi:hypothetical protein
MKVVNVDGVFIATKVATKQHHNMPITQRLKWLFLSEEIMKQIRWHKEGKHDSEDFDIMLHPVDGEAW